MFRGSGLGFRSLNLELRVESLGFGVRVEGFRTDERSGKTSDERRR